MSFLAKIILVLGVGWLAPVQGQQRAPVEVRPPSDELPEEPPGGIPTAQALPHEVTICRGEHRCWSEPGRSRCEGEGGERARPFGVFRVDETDSLARALRQCWETQKGN